MVKMNCDGSSKTDTALQRGRMVETPMHDCLKTNPELRQKAQVV